MTPPRSRRPDCCAVETRRLAPVVQDFVDEWRRQHADLASSEEGEQRQGAGTLRNDRGQLAGNESVGAVTILHERTVQLAARVPGGRGVSERTIRRILKSRSMTTELRTADALLTAAGRWDAFYDGSVPVMPNPHAAPSERATCCGGSTPPSLNGSFS